MNPVPKLKIVSRVTRWHGRTFAKLILAWVERTEIPSEVFAMTGIMEAPEDDDLDTPPHWRHQRIEDEIMRRVFNEIEERLCDTFMTIAGEVIQRERERQGE
jgi:hypothetical protein